MLPLRKKINQFFRHLGPGFVTGASDDDPSGIATYSQTGASFGYRQLWLPVLSIPLTIVVQEICARIGLVTGKGLSGNIRQHYSHKLLYSATILLLLANTVNIGANLGAMASSLQLLLNLPFWFYLILITTLTLALEIFIPYATYVKYLKFLGLTLLAYIATAFIVKQDWPTILKFSFIPQFSLQSDYLLNLVAFLGTTLSPYLFFWQGYEEIEEQIIHHRSKHFLNIFDTYQENRLHHMRWDTILGMGFSNVVAFFIIITAASTLGVHGISQIQTAADAAEALRPLAGQFTFILFTLGIIGSGLLGIPVLAGSAAYALGETFDQKVGLYRQFKDAKFFYSIIILSILAGLCINFLPIPPFRLLYYSAVLNGLIAAPILILIMLISNNHKIMGRHTNTPFSKYFGWFVTLIMIASSAFLFADFFQFI